MYQFGTFVDGGQFSLELRGETNRGSDGALGILGAVSNDQCCKKRPIGVLSREGEATVSEAEQVLLLVIDQSGIALPYLPGFLLCSERRFAQAPSRRPPSHNPPRVPTDNAALVQRFGRDGGGSPGRTMDYRI